VTLPSIAFFRSISQMIENIILEEPSAPLSLPTAPCLAEREQYLFHLMRQGYGHDYLRSISGSMLQVVRFLGLTTLSHVGSKRLRDRSRLGRLSRAGSERKDAQLTRAACRLWRRIAFAFTAGWNSTPPVHVMRRKIAGLLSCSLDQTDSRPHGSWVQLASEVIPDLLLSRAPPLASVSLNDVE